MNNNTYLKNLHPVALGNALALMEALLIFAVTIILYIQGDRGAVYLSRFFPGYEISIPGAFLGLVEGYIDGFIVGLILALGYNMVTRIISK